MKPGNHLFEEALESLRKLDFLTRRSESNSGLKAKRREPTSGSGRVFVLSPDTNECLRGGTEEPGAGKGVGLSVAGP
jgi:hypothetical protein